MQKVIFTIEAHTLDEAHEVITRLRGTGATVVSTSTGPAPSPAPEEKPKRGRKPAAKKPVEDDLEDMEEETNETSSDDDFDDMEDGDEEEETEEDEEEEERISGQEIKKLRTALTAYSEEHGRNASVKVLQKFTESVEKTSKANYPKLMKALKV